MSYIKTPLSRAESCSAALDFLGVVDAIPRGDTAAIQLLVPPDYDHAVAALSLAAAMVSDMTAAGGAEYVEGIRAMLYAAAHDDLDGDDQ